MVSEGQPKADTKGVSLKAPGTGRETYPSPACLRPGVYSGRMEQCYSRKKRPPPSTGLARGAMHPCPPPPPSLSPGWVSSALAQSHAAHVCHHRGFFFFFLIFLCLCSPIPSEDGKQQLLGEEVGDLGSFRLGGNTSSSVLTPHDSPVPQHPLAVTVLAVTQHTLRGAWLHPAYIWPRETAPAEQLSPCSGDPGKPQTWLQPSSGEARLWSSPPRISCLRAEASQEACTPGMVGVQGSMKLSSSILCTATFPSAAWRNQPNESSAPAEGYRAKAEPCLRCSAFSRIKL